MDNLGGTETNFQIGDIVSAFGLSGTVIRITEGIDYPITVSFSDIDYTDIFTADGRHNAVHILASLHLIRRAEPKAVAFDDYGHILSIEEAIEQLGLAFTVNMQTPPIKIVLTKEAYQFYARSIMSKFATIDSNVIQRNTSSGKIEIACE